MEPSSDAPPSQTTLKLYLLPLQLMLRFPLLPPKGKGNVCNNRKKYIAWDHFEKVDIGEGHFKAV